MKPMILIMFHDRLKIRLKRNNMKNTFRIRRTIITIINMWMVVLFFTLCYLLIKMNYIMPSIDLSQGRENVMSKALYWIVFERYTTLTIEIFSIVLTLFYLRKMQESIYLKLLLFLIYVVICFFSTPYLLMVNQYIMSFNIYISLTLCLAFLIISILTFRNLMSRNNG